MIEQERHRKQDTSWNDAQGELIIGNGTVGGATAKLFTHPHLLDSPANSGMDAYLSCLSLHWNVVFICLPTPMNSQTGALETCLIDDVLPRLSANLIVIRSTVNVGDCERWDKRFANVCYWPEFVGESTCHPYRESCDRGSLLIGGRPSSRRQLIDILPSMFNASMKLRQMDLRSAELAKLAENRAVALRVMEFQELYDVCTESGIDYYEVREAIYGDDPRFSLWWSFIDPRHRAMHSKCLPKDAYAFLAHSRRVGSDAPITKSALDYDAKLRSLEEH